MVWQIRQLARKHSHYNTKKKERKTDRQKEREKMGTELHHVPEHTVHNLQHESPATRRCLPTTSART